MKKYFALLSLSLFSISSFAQNMEDMLDEVTTAEPKQKVFATFKSTYLISSQTNETVKKGTLDFRITHRFGDVAGASGGVHNFYGFDNASNIRFSFDYGITDKLQLGIGRSKINENLDGSIKYKIWEQREKSIPFSVVGYASTTLTPKKNTSGDYDNFSNRLSFSYQLIIASKVNSRFSYSILPTLIHRNMIHTATNSFNNAHETNDIYALGAAARFKLTRRFAIIAECFYAFSDYRINNPSTPYYLPLGVGIEIETGGHVFQINLTNTSGLINTDFIPSSPDSWLKGQYKLGFTISRPFGKKVQ